MNILNSTKAAEVDMMKYESLMSVIHYLENLGENEAKVLLWSLPKEGFMKNDIVDYFFKEANMAADGQNKLLGKIKSASGILQGKIDEL